MKSLKEVMCNFPAEIIAKYDFGAAVYKGATVRIEGVVCPEHGEFSQYSARFRKGAGCPDCGATRRVKSQRKSPEEFFSEVTEIHGGLYSYQNDYVKMASDIYPICPEHGEFRIRALKHYYEKQGCGKCEIEKKRSRILEYRHLSHASKIRNTGKDFFEKCRISHEGRYEYPEQEYQGAKESIRIVCEKHGEFSQLAWDHLSGRGCPQCGAYTPKWESDLVNFVEELGFSVETNVPILNGRHVDVYLPEKRIGIELHGLRWHTDKKRPKRYHFEKWKVATDKGIRLVQVFEDEWVSKKDIVLNRIQAICGVSSKLAARKCRVSELEWEVAKKFMNENHIQGFSKQGFHYGLFYKDDLMAVASFCPMRTGAMVSGSQGDCWEVLRYASIGRVQGGFSKLLSHFKKEFDPKKLVSYCDLRYGDGALYESCGFNLDGITEPDYWWVRPGKIERVPRYRTQKHKLKTHPVLKDYFDPKLTENEICRSAGWERIYGVGSQRWIWLSQTFDTVPTSC